MSYVQLPDGVYSLAGVTGSTELSKSYSDMGSKMFTFTQEMR